MARQLAVHFFGNSVFDPPREQGAATWLEYRSVVFGYSWL